MFNVAPHVLPVKAMVDGNPQPGAIPPSKATDAVLVASDPVAEGVQQVHGIEFNDYHDADITVTELVDGMAKMGFQASAVGDAVRIINEMVRP